MPACTRRRSLSYLLPERAVCMTAHLSTVRTLAGLHAHRCWRLSGVLSRSCRLPSSVARSAAYAIMGAGLPPRLSTATWLHRADHTPRTTLIAPRKRGKTPTFRYHVHTLSASKHLLSASLQYACSSTFSSHTQPSHNLGRFSLLHCHFRLLCAALHTHFRHHTTQPPLYGNTGAHASL